MAKKPPKPQAPAVRDGAIPLTSWIQACSSALALVLAATALYFSYAAHLTQAENLAVSIAPLATDYETSISEGPPVPLPKGWPGVILTKWSAALTNASQRGLSIVEYEVEPMYPTDVAQAYLISGIEDEDGKNKPLPVDIEPGKSVRLVLAIGLPIRERAVQVIREAYASGTRLMMADLRLLLDSQGTDFWGNTVMSGVAKRQPDGSIKMEFVIGKGPRLEVKASGSSGPGGVQAAGRVVADAPARQPDASRGEKDVTEMRLVKQPPDRTPYLTVTFKTARGNRFASKAEWK